MTESLLASMWDAFRGLGALAGFFASAYILRDRFYKHYPVAVIVARPLLEGSVQIVPWLWIRNVSDRPILVAWQDGNPHGFRVARDNSSIGVVRTLFDGRSVLSLSPNQERYLDLLKPADYADIDPSNVIEVIVEWKFAQPILWQRYRKLRISIVKEDLEHLIEGYSDRSAPH